MGYLFGTYRGFRLEPQHNVARSHRQAASPIMSWASSWRPARAACEHPSLRQRSLASSTPPGAHSCRCWSAKREVKDPKSFDSMDQLREQLGQASSPGLVTSLVNWLSKAAASTTSGFDLKAIYKRLLAMAQPSSGGNGWADELAELDRLEAEIGQETVQQLATVLLGTRQSTLRIIRRYPAILKMSRSHIMERLIWLKGEFPGSDVTRMVELQPAAFLGGDWHSVRKQLAGAAHTLREGLQGANFDFMFQEDPAILHEDVESLRVGVRQLHELWAVDEAALANSSPLHLTLAVRALGPKGPPRKF